MGVLSAEVEAEFLDRVYEAALDPLLWEPLLGHLCDVFGAANSNLTFQNQVTGEGRALLARVDPAAIPLYFGYFGTRNPLLRIADLPAQPRVMTDEDKVPKAELMRSEYYNDFMRHYEAHSVMMMRLAVDETSSASLNIARPAHRPPFDWGEVALANRFLPHLVRSLRLTLRLCANQRLCDGMSEYADRSLHAVFLVDGDATLHHVNRTAQMMLVSQDGLSANGRVLRARQLDATRKLHGLIAQAGDHDRDRRKGGDMTLARLESENPLFISVTPVRGEQRAIFGGMPTVLVCVSDPDAEVPISDRRLRESLGLSRAESRIAIQLMDGCSPREAAERLGISYYTVRGHLARMFGKTGTHRQSELVRLMLCAIGDMDLRA